MTIVKTKVIGEVDKTPKAVTIVVTTIQTSEVEFVAVDIISTKVSLIINSSLVGEEVPPTTKHKTNKRVIGTTARIKGNRTRFRASSMEITENNRNILNNSHHITRTIEMTKGTKPSSKLTTASVSKHTSNATLEISTTT